MPKQSEIATLVNSGRYASFKIEIKNKRVEINSAGKTEE